MSLELDDGFVILGVTSVVNPDCAIVAARGEPGSLEWTPGAAVNSGRVSVRLYDRPVRSEDDTVSIPRGRG